jgi:hypothetical protein
MSKKTYELVAGVMANNYECDDWKETTDKWFAILADLCTAFKKDNPRFDERKFRKACMG